MKITEENYLEQLMQQNEKALLYVIDTYGDLLFSIVRKRLFALVDYEQECLNDILLGIWYHIQDFHPEKSSFSNWIAGIARFKSIDYLRKYYRQIPLETLDEVEVPDMDLSLESLMEQEISDELVQMLQCLSQQDQELFLKLYLEDKDMEEVSLETGLKKENIYNRISRGKKRIKQAYCDPRR